MSAVIESQKKQNEMFLICLLDNNNYGFPIMQVDGIISIPKIVPIHRTPNYFKGIINVRGQIVPVIDLRLLFNMTEINYGEQTCVVLVNTKIDGNEKIIGFVVDTVSEVFDIPKSEIENSPSDLVRTQNNFLSGIGKIKDKIIMILDVDKITSVKEALRLADNEIEQIEKYLYKEEKGV